MEPAVYTPQPLAPTHPQTAPGVLPAQQMTIAYLPTSDGQMVATYVAAPAVQSVVIAAAQQPATRAAVAHPLAVNVFLGAGSFALAALGLHLLAAFVEALAHLVQTLVLLAAIVCGAPVALQLLRAQSGGHAGGTQTVIHARKVRIRRMIVKGGR